MLEDEFNSGKQGVDGEWCVGKIQSLMAQGHPTISQKVRKSLCRSSAASAGCRCFSIANNYKCTTEGLRSNLGFTRQPRFTYHFTARMYSASIFSASIGAISNCSCSTNACLMLAFFAASK